MARIEVIRSGLDRWSLKTLAGFDVGCRDFIRTRTGDSGSGRSHERLAPEEGLEPSTHRLTADCSTIELLWNARRRRKLAVGISLRQRAFVADFAAWMAGEAEMAKGQAAGSGVECACGGLRGAAAGWVLGTGCPVKLGAGCGERMRQAVGSGSAGPCLCSQEGSGKVWVFALRARGGFVRLQCSLRHCPAAAGWVLGTGYPLKLVGGFWGQATP